MRWAVEVCRVSAEPGGGRHPRPPVQRGWSQPSGRLDPLTLLLREGSAAERSWPGRPGSGRVPCAPTPTAGGPPTDSRPRW